MGYEIIYGGGPRRPANRKVWFAVLLILGLAAGSILTRDRLPSREPEAARCLVSQISQGESVTDALRTYCRTVIEHGIS